MATAVRVTRGLTANTTSGIGQQLTAALAKDVAERLEAETVRRVNAIVAKEFNNARPTSQRRPGRHLLGSFTATTRLESGPYPVVLTLRSNAPAVKVNVLNNGSSDHDIGADGRFVAFPAANGTKSRTTGDRRAVRKGPIHVSGVKPSWFMQRSMEQAVAAIYHKTVRIPRR